MSITTWLWTSFCQHEDHSPDWSLLEPLPKHVTKSLWKALPSVKEPSRPAGWKGEDKLSTMVWQAEMFRLINAIAAKPDMPLQPPLCRWREAEQARSHDRGPRASSQLARMGLAWGGYESHGAGESPSLDIAQAVSREGAASQVSSLLTKDSRFCTIPIFLQAELESAGRPHSAHYPVSPSGSRLPANNPQGDLALKCSWALITSIFTTWTAGWTIIPWEVGLAAMHCTGHRTTSVIWQQAWGDCGSVKASLGTSAQHPSFLHAPHCCDVPQSWFSAPWLF